MITVWSVNEISLHLTLINGNKQEKTETQIWSTKLFSRSVLNNNTSFSWKVIIYSIFCCFKRKCRKNWSELAEQSVVFSNGCDKINEELDVVSLVNSVRRANILVSVLLNEKQQALCRYQNSILLDSKQESKRNLSYKSKTWDQQWHDDIDAILKDDDFNEEQEVNHKLIEGVVVFNNENCISQPNFTSKINTENIYKGNSAT